MTTGSKGSSITLKYFHFLIVKVKLLIEYCAACEFGILKAGSANMKKKNLLARNPECAACEMFKECGVGCRASALTETGDLMAKDPIACDLWKNGYKKRFEELAMAAIKE